MRGFVGLVSFFRRFIKGFAVIARPITNLLAKNILFIWGKEQEKSFEILKNALTNKLILAMYNPEGYTEVHTDACINGVAGVLKQRQLDGNLHPISYYSRKTSKEEANINLTS